MADSNASYTTPVSGSVHSPTGTEGNADMDMKFCLYTLGSAALLHDSESGVSCSDSWCTTAMAGTGATKGYADTPSPACSTVF